MTTPAIQEDDSPFLSSDPPNWVARGLSTVLIALFGVALLGSVVVHVPETVDGRFTLVPERGTDPVRALRDGIVASVNAAEGRHVDPRTTLFVIRSPTTADRTAEMRTVQMQATSVTARLQNAQAEFETQKRADEAELTRLSRRVAALEHMKLLKQQQLTLVQQMSERLRGGHTAGAVTDAEYARLELQSKELASAVEQSDDDAEETRASITHLRNEMEVRALRERELERSLAQERDVAKVRITTLQPEMGVTASGEMTVSAPCAGTVLRLDVNAPGAVVKSGDVLGEIACDDRRLQAEVTVPQSGIGQVNASQPVKLLYDAFPYQRYGVRHGRIRWVGPAGVADAGAAFRALVDLDETEILADGARRTFLPGMQGKAQVVVGRRSLVSYAFAPIRQLRESFAGEPGR